ncbi:SRPBCC family protein [Streptomyces sp. NPDC101133]|uniref:SRPBCC family protein n=1 Tax=Streptomyces sp. NPDC101133 TaxID=3366111 RepID=UPI00382D9464
MPETQKFVAGATVTVDAQAHDVWALWADVNAWKTWDTGIESTVLHGNFKAGATFTLTPQGGEPMEVTVVTVTQGEEFSDETRLPFGTIRTCHRMEPIGARVRITHEVVAEVAADAVGFFGREVWPHLQSGVAESLGNVADIVGND